MSMGRLCDIFPNSRGPVHEYVLRFVRIIPGAEPPHATEEVMFTVTRDMGKRALDRAINGVEVATSPPKKEFMGFPIKQMEQPVDPKKHAPVASKK